MKFLWFSFVCLGFLGASVLISKSYFEWQKHPVTTFISTLSISDLKFPNITVCPPKLSNTALNYDLIKAGNDPLTEEVKDKLLHKLYTIFVGAPFQEQWNRKSAEINSENFETLSKGYQTVPTLTDDNITETLFCSTSGTFHTPYFPGELEESFRSATSCQASTPRKCEGIHWEWTSLNRVGGGHQGGGGGHQGGGGVAMT